MHIIKQLDIKPIMFNNFPIYKYAQILYFKSKRKIYLIRPVYHKYLPDFIFNQLNIDNIYYNNNKLTNYKYHSSGNCQHSTIIEISLNDDLPEKIDITIDNETLTIESIEKYLKYSELSITTLFKKDYKNTNLFIDYYYNYHNIKTFYLYYNESIKDINSYIFKLKIPSDCDVIFFEFNYPYWQEFYNLNFLEQHKIQYWPHASQNIQLSHSCIIANYYSGWLLNLDLDEYIDPLINLNKYLNDKYDTIILKYLICKCNGLLCTRDYDYNYENIIKNIDVINTENNGKFLERTLNKRIFNRNVHYSDRNYGHQITIENSLYHVKCLSFKTNIKRLCK